MKREIVEPTKDKWDNDVHPAFGMIGAARGSSSPGAVLFDSDIKHASTVTITLKRGQRHRDLNRDWLGTGEQLFEVEMSEAQWASFVSSMNTGDGVPCTIRATPGVYDVPGVPYDPRLKQSMTEVREAARRAFEQIKEARDAYEQKKTAANLKALHYAIEHAVANVDYASKTLNEHAENVVQRARADIEAIVLGKARQLGIEASQLNDTLEIESS
jgi:hypothetical protein